MIRYDLLMAGITLFASTVASAQGLDGLFFQMKFAFGQLQESHYFFTPNGRYLNSVPSGTLDAAGMDRACAEPRNSCGTYRIAGSQLVLTPAKGAPQTVELERIADGNLKIGGLFAKHVDKFPPGAKLDGRYSRSAGAGAVSAASTFVFKPDGTLTARQVAPGRRTLAPHEVKYSTLVLDGAPIDKTDIVVVGINQVQRAGSEAWWRAELQRAAEAAVPLKKK